MRMVSGKLCPSGRFRSGFPLLFALLTLALLPVASAQETATASITGTVSSTKGGVIAGAKVFLTDKATAKTSVVNTDANGNFTAPDLVPSDYALRVEARSFVTETVNLTAHAGAPTRTDVLLSPEPVPGEVDVSKIADLPFNGRDFLQGASLETGMQIFDAGSLDSAKNGLFALSFTNTTGRVRPAIDVDGLTVADQSSGYNTQNIPVSSIQEFRYGGVLGPISEQLYSPGTLNFVSSSGSNTLHGDLFGLYRAGDVLSASLPGGHNNHWGRQQYGGDLGGALIPDKLYFSANVQRNKQDLTNSVLLGDPFSALVPFGTVLQSEPFREFETSDRLDYKLSDTTRAFYRFTYDQNNDTGPLGQGPSLQSYQSKTNTPANALGLDFNSGSFVNALRFEYMKFKNVVSQPATLASGVPAPVVTVNIGGGATTQCNGSSLYCAGPSPFSSQQTQQSNFQFRYDGSRAWNNHIFHVGASFDRIRSGLFNSPYALGPGLSDQGSVVLPSGIFGSDGNPAHPANYPVQWAFLGNGQGFASEKSAFGMAGGGFGNNQLDIYGGDTWKVRPNITLTYGVHWLRNSGLSNSDLPAIPALDAWGPGLGNKVRQPNLNFAPQLGVAWDPSASGKTIVRAGAGLFYDNSLFRNLALDRPLRLAQGTFNSTPAACIGGFPGEIQWPNAGTSGTVAGGAGKVNANGTVSPTWCGQSIGMAAPQAAALQTAYQAAVAAAAGVNANYIGNPGAYAGPYVNGLSLLAPNYQTPRTFQMNIGLQHELSPGLTLTADYLRNVATRTLLGIDVNQGGAANTFSVANAVNDRDTAQSTAGCPIGPGEVGCMVGKLGPAGALAAYGAAGIGGPAQVTGGAPCPFCAFPGVHPNLGVNVMNFPVGRSVYSGELVSLRKQFATFARGVRGASFQFSYAHSRYVSQSDDEDLTPVATDYANPDRFTGPGALDRTHQISIAGHFDLQRSFQLSFISHLFSPLPQTLRFQQSSGGAEVLVTDVNGDGSTGDLIPGTSIGSYMRSIKASGLSTLVSSYNSEVAGSATPVTPAGQQLTTSGVFSLQELEQMGGVLQPLAATVPDVAGLGWLKTFDLRLGWQHKFGDRFTITPSLALFNVFNFANFDLPGNTQSGVLNFGAGSLSPWATTLQPQNTVGGTSPAGISARSNRASLQSGMSAAGAPRSAEWGLKISF